MFFDYPIQVFFESISYPIHAHTEIQALLEMVELQRQYVQKLRLLLQQKKKLELKNKRLSKLKQCLKQRKA